MKRKAKILLAVAVFALVWQPPMTGLAANLSALEADRDESAAGKPGPAAGLLDKGVEAYEQSEFQAALGYLNAGLATAGLTAAEKVSLHQYKAYTLMGLNDRMTVRG